MHCQHMQSMILFPPEQREQEEKHLRQEKREYPTPGDDASGSPGSAPLLH